MATQTGSIDLAASNAVKLYADAGFSSAASTYATKSELTVEAGAIRSEVSSTYATKAEVADTNARTSTLEQTADGFTASITEITTSVSDLGDEISGKADASDLDALADDVVRSSEERMQWLRYAAPEGGTAYLELGDSASSHAMRVTTDAMGFYDGSRELATYGGADGAHAPMMTLDESLAIDDWVWERRSDGHLTLKKL